MPDWKTQRTSLSAFRQRVNDEYKRAVTEAEPLQALSSIENRVRQSIEAELLHQAQISS